MDKDTQLSFEPSTAFQNTFSIQATGGFLEFLFFAYFFFEGKKYCLSASSHESKVQWMHDLKLAIDKFGEDQEKEKFVQDSFDALIDAG